MEKFLFNLEEAKELENIQSSGYFFVGSNWIWIC